MYRLLFLSLAASLLTALNLTAFALDYGDVTPRLRQIVSTDAKSPRPPSEVPNRQPKQRIPNDAAPRESLKVSPPVFAAPKANGDVELPAATKAVEVLASAFSLKKQTSFPRELNAIKDCHGLTDADTKALFVGRLNGSKRLLLVLVKGEKSGLHVILGIDCNSSVKMPLVATIALSIAAERAERRSNKIPILALVPIERLNNGANSSENETRYRTHSGSVDIKYDEVSKHGKIIVYGAENEVIFEDDFKTE